MTSATRSFLLSILVLSISVSLGAQKIATNPTSLSFNATVGGAATSQNLSVDVGQVGTPFSLAASTSSGGNWLAVTPGTGAGGGQFTVTATPGTLAAGTYQGAVTITASGSTNSPLAVPVTMVLTGSTGGGLLIGTSPSSLSFNATVGGAATS